MAQPRKHGLGYDDTGHGYGDTGIRHIKEYPGLGKQKNRIYICFYNNSNKTVFTVSGNQI